MDTIDLSNKKFFSNIVDFIKKMQSKPNQTGIIYNDYYISGIHILNDICKYLKINDYTYTRNIPYSKIILSNNSEIILTLKYGNIECYRGLTINVVLFCVAPEDEFFTYILPMVR